MGLIDIVAHVEGKIPQNHNDKDHQVLHVSHPNLCPINPRWQMAAILKKNNKLPYVSNGLTNFRKI